MATCFSAPNQSCRTYEGDVLIEHGEFTRVRTVEMNRNIVSRFTVTLAPAPTLFYRNICTWQNCLRGPSAEKTGRGSLLNRPSCSPDDPVGQGIELNCLDSLTEDLKFLLGLKRNLSVYCSYLIEPVRKKIDIQIRYTFFTFKSHLKFSVNIN